MIDVMPERPVPDKPLLKPWYRLAYEDDSIAFKSGPHIVKLEGRAIQRLLPALLPLLDGNRSLEDILQLAKPELQPAIMKAFDVLNGHGLLFEGEEPVELLDTQRIDADYFVSMGYETSRQAYANRLELGSCTVVGQNAQSDKIVRLLRRTGLRTVNSVSLDCSVDELPKADFVIVVPDSNEIDAVDVWNARLLADDVSWMAVAPLEGRYVAVGPLFVPGETACWNCYRTRLLSRAKSPALTQSFQRSQAYFPVHEALQTMIAGTAVMNAIRWMFFRDAFQPGMVVSIEVGRCCQTEMHEVFRLPRCAACGIHERQGVLTPWYEEAIA